MNYFELVMLICFSMGWPFSIYKSLKSKSNKGKSLWYMLVILIGYSCGILYKITSTIDVVIWLYVANTLMVLLDISLYWRNSTYGGDVS